MRAIKRDGDWDERPISSRGLGRYPLPSSPGDSVLDSATGELVLPSADTRLGPTTTRTRFLDSWLGVQATAGVINEPWANYTLELPPGEVGPFPATVTLQFHGDRLAWISVMNVSPEFGTGWHDWSAAKEQARLAAHDRWLADIGVPAGDYWWGRVWSIYEDRTALSAVTLRYDPYEPR